MLNLVDNDVLKLSVVSRASHTVVMCFTGIGHAIGGVDVQGEEFFKISSGATTIFVIDKQRSWGNNIDFLEVKRIVSPFIEGKTLYAIGNSMGGFLAILASRFVPMTAVVAFAPQYTVSKRLLPTETRWDKYVNNIKYWQFESLEGAFNPNTQYYVLAALSVDERKQLDLFPAHENLHKILFTDPVFVHNVAAILKDQNMLYEVISDCFMLKSSVEIIQLITSRSQGGITLLAG